MFALSNLNSIETRIFERFLKFNRFERHSCTLKNVEIQDQKKHSGIWLSQLRLRLLEFKQSFLYDLMKKPFWVNEMVNFGSALSTPYFPSEDDPLTYNFGC